MFQVTILKILGKVGTHIFFNYSPPQKSIILCILKGILPFKMHKIIFFPENLKKLLGNKGSPVNFGGVGLPKTQVFFYLAFPTDTFILIEVAVWHRTTP